MLLQDKIQKQIIEALKSHEQVRLDTLRMLSSALKYSQIDKMRELTEPEELEVVKKEAKKRQDAIEAYKSAQAFDRAAKETQELAILKELLPDDLNDQEIEKIVDEAMNAGNADFGTIMKFVMAKSAGRADGKRVSDIVRKKTV